MSIKEYNEKLQTLVNGYATGLITLETFKKAVEVLNEAYWKANPKEDKRWNG